MLYQPVGDGAVLFSTQDEVYFGLNGVGAAAWEALPPVNMTWGDLVAFMRRAYPDVADDVLRADLAVLVGELLAHGLVSPDQDG